MTQPIDTCAHHLYYKIIKGFVIRNGGPFLPHKKKKHALLKSNFKIKIIGEKVIIRTWKLKLWEDNYDTKSQKENAIIMTLCHHLNFFTFISYFYNPIKVFFPNVLKGLP